MKLKEVLPAALRRTVLYNGRPMKSKELIETLILNEGYHTLEKIKRSSGVVYRLKKGKLKYTFNTIAEIAYIDEVFKSINIDTNVPIENSRPLIRGGKIQKQDIKNGAVLIGPSHENGGIPIIVNNKQVAEAQGGEAVIEAKASEKHCEQLSEINQSEGGVALDCDTIQKSEQGAQTCGCDHKEAEIEIAAKGAIIKKSESIPSTPYSINKQIEALLDSKGANPDNYNSDEKLFLRQYSGYGGLTDENITIEQAKQSFTEFYTPNAIVQKMWALAYKYGFKDGQSILEPSVGTGEFLKYVPAQSTATGYEINKYSYTICKIIFPQFNFYYEPFENIFIKNRDSIKSKTGELKKYNLVIGNPPYGDVGGLGMGMGEKQYTHAKNWIEYFILRGLDLTLPGGLLIYIIGTEVANGGIPFLQQGPSKTKELIAQRADLIDAYRLPNGVFERTDVLTDIVVFKKK